MLFIPLLLGLVSTTGQKSGKEQKHDTVMKMKVEIWSDVVCPWCYIGKRRFESAMAQFPHAEYIEVEWKSYELMPDGKTDTTVSIYELLSKKYNVSLSEAKGMCANVTEVASELGLDYRFDQVHATNTINAHCLLHFAHEQGKQDAMKERLLRAYFTEGKNVDDIPTLLALAKEVGLDTNGLQEALESGKYRGAVKADITEGHQLGLRGVPFFVMNRKFGVSGAQESKAFLQTLEKAYADWRKDNPEVKLEMTEGKVCKPDGTCD